MKNKIKKRKILQNIIDEIKNQYISERKEEIELLKKRIEKLQMELISVGERGYYSN